MASSLAALLAQHAPVQTRKGLILTGLQNDFLSPEGKLPVNTSSEFLDRLSELVTEFREHGDIIWVRSHFVENRTVNEDDETGDAVVVGLDASDDDQPPHATATPIRNTTAHSAHDSYDEDPPSPPKRARLSSEPFEPPVVALELTDRPTPSQEPVEPVEPDEELFLTRTANREPCCIPGSFGAEYPKQVKDLVNERRDLQLIKTYYSAFASTSLLGTLRANLVTELYICGCTTNLSLFATAVDAARHGISVTLVEDCLGYRRRDRHDKAIQELHEIMGARLMTSGQVIDRLRNPLAESEDEDSEDERSQLSAQEGNDEEYELALVANDDALEVDSGDEDEDDIDLLTTNVRLTRFGGRSVALREAFPVKKSPGLPEAAAVEQELRPPSQPGEPSHPRATDTVSNSSGDDGTAAGASETSGGGDTSESSFDGWIGRATSTHTCSVTADKDKDESSTEVINAQWQGWKAIKKEWAAFNKASIPGPQSKHSGLSAMCALAGLDQKTVNEYEEMMIAARHITESERSGTQPGNGKPLFGNDKATESAGSRIHYDLLPPNVAEAIFEQLNSEIKWQTMIHLAGEVPRLVCCQGTIDVDGSMPVYRHPSDQTLPIESWTPTVDKVRKAAETIVGHELNHALIQLYRNGKDFISEHSDKTLDIAKDSSIVNVSFGAQRTMRLRTKRAGASISGDPSPARTTHRIPMPHNSMIVMALPTNAEYLHGINADKRLESERSEDELAYDGQRISLTFRSIGTYLNKDSSRIWGRGATAQSKEQAREVVNAHAAESERLVRAFGKENAASSVDWDEIYGGGFDVLHLK